MTIRLSHAQKNYAVSRSDVYNLHFMPIRGRGCDAVPSSLSSVSLTLIWTYWWETWAKPARVTTSTRWSERERSFGKTWGYFLLQQIYQTQVDIFGKLPTSSLSWGFQNSFILVVSVILSTGLGFVCLDLWANLKIFSTFTLLVWLAYGWFLILSFCYICYGQLTLEQHGLELRGST